MSYDDDGDGNVDGKDLFFIQYHTYNVNMYMIIQHSDCTKQYSSDMLYKIC